MKCNPNRTAAFAPRRHTARWLGTMGLSALLLIQPARAQEGSVEQRLEQRQSFAVAAQPLADALTEFALQAGVQIAVDSALVKGLDSPGVAGEWSARQALQRLLGGTRLRWRPSDGNSLTLEPDPRAADEEAPLLLPDIVVLSSAEQNYQGEAVIDRRAIEHFPGANGDLTTLLKMHPSVRFDTTQQSSSTPGEISPADISINGAKFYQNNFMNKVGRVGAALTWDTRIKFDLPLRRGESAYAAVTITNLTNRVNEILGDSGTLSYEVGRQYWLELGYQF
ncbi:hypothetical protein E6C76_00825 [Pseudothauera nasutitermitis]|uniref:Secretin/TonB short N-terminal domain-containing protein n=1 Tax=Pseudothauera nasutitermitis TaxID=2565930 RepID=A0A4S4B2U7_9RHOO|nr:STN domain-containing protein [Pseudothauera nasutitermitis]THF66970.1 hypothetical protein E6C76_00825 [Pseudothauera nasutitermitis]